MALVKTIKDRNTDDTIYPITKADAVYLSDNETTVEGALGDLSTISSIGNGTITGAISTLNSNLDGLYQFKTYEKQYTIAANSVLNMSGTDFNFSTPSGYLAAAVIYFTSGDNNVIVRGINAETVFGGAVFLRNLSSSAVTATARITILYMKTIFQL